MFFLSKWLLWKYLEIPPHWRLFFAEELPGDPKMTCLCAQKKEPGRRYIPFGYRRIARGSWLRNCWHLALFYCNKKRRIEFICGMKRYLSERMIYLKTPSASWLRSVAKLLKKHKVEAFELCREFCATHELGFTNQKGDSFSEYFFVRLLFYITESAI